MVAKKEKNQIGISFSFMNKRIKSFVKKSIVSQIIKKIKLNWHLFNISCISLILIKIFLIFILKMYKINFNLNSTNFC